MQNSLAVTHEDHNLRSEIQTQQLQTRLNDYMRELKKTRDLRDKEDKHVKEKMKLITRTWKQIKAVRQKSGYTSTNLKLLLQK